MNNWNTIFEKVTMYAGIIFAFSLFFMLVRMKLTKTFEMRDHVASSLSFDLDFKVLTKIRNTYAEHFGKILPNLNLYSFVIMVSGIILLTIIPVCIAFWEVR